MIFRFFKPMFDFIGISEDQARKISLLGRTIVAILKISASGGNIDSEDFARLAKLYQDYQKEFGVEEARNEVLSYINKNWKNIKYLKEAPKNTRNYDMLLILDDLQFAEHKDTKFLYCWNTYGKGRNMPVYNNPIKYQHQRKAA